MFDCWKLWPSNNGETEVLSHQFLGCHYPIFRQTQTLIEPLLNPVSSGFKKNYTYILGEGEKTMMPQIYSIS
jgi:hypothetical protein